jgi:hypothetical protein
MNGASYARDKFNVPREDKLRAESTALIHANAELSQRLVVIEKAMMVVFG